MLMKFIRRLFANLAKTGESTDKAPYLRTPAYMTEVEENLDRYFGLKIERRNPHIPTMRADQFDRDVAATRHGRRIDPGMQSMSAFLQDGAAAPPSKR